MQPMQLRYKFGPSLSPVHLKRPAVAGELPDLEVTADFGDLAPGPNGTVNAPIVVTVPAYTPGVTHNRLVAVYALAVLPGVAEPTDPEAAVNSLHPQASADASDHTDGGDLVVSLEGLPEGRVKIITVLAFGVDPTPADPAPSDPTPPITADPIAVAVADPSAPAS